MNIIPLGDNCAISMILKDLEKREKSYPFDWISSLGPDPTYSSIEITMNLLIELLKTNNSKHICNKLLGDSIDNNNKVFNTIIFPHDHGTVEEINTKYLRRLNRLYNDVMNHNNNIFVIITRYYFIPEEKIIELCNTFLNLNINYKILFYSGINHDYCKKLTNVFFTHIPYDVSSGWQDDYSKFRPQLKICLEHDIQIHSQPDSMWRNRDIYN